MPSLIGDDLELLDDQPEVVEGGSLEGYVYYLINATDTNLLLVVNGDAGNQFIDIANEGRSLPAKLTSPNLLRHRGVPVFTQIGDQQLLRR